MSLEKAVIELNDKELGDEIIHHQEMLKSCKSAALKAIISEHLDLMLRCNIDRIASGLRQTVPTCKTVLNITEQKIAVGVHGTVLLGQLIDMLSKRSDDQNVYYDFGRLVPSGLQSYRGYYEHLALGWSTEMRVQSPTEFKNTVRELVSILQLAIGEKFTGYKGGTYTMDKMTPVWMDNYGDCTETAILGISEKEEDQVILLTGHVK